MKIKATKIEDIKQATYGDLLFFKPSSFTSSLIPLVDGSPYSHVAMFLGHKYGNPIFIESQDGIGIIIRKVQDWKNYDIYRVTSVCPKSINSVVSDLSKPYDRKKITDILWHKLAGVPLYADSDSAMICSEAVNRWYDYKLFEKGQATPATIFHNLEL